MGAHSLQLVGTSWGEAVCVDYLAAHPDARVPEAAQHLLGRALGLDAPGDVTCAVAAALLPAVRRRCPHVDDALLWPEVRTYNEAAMRDAADRALSIVDLSEDSIVEAVLARALADVPGPAYALQAALVVVGHLSAAAVAVGAHDPAYGHAAQALGTLTPAIWYGVHMGMTPRKPLSLAKRQLLVRIVAIFDALCPTFRTQVLAVPDSLKEDDEMRVRWRLGTQQTLLARMDPEQIAAGEALLASAVGQELAAGLPAISRQWTELKENDVLHQKLDAQIDAALAAIRDEVWRANQAALPPPQDQDAALSPISSAQRTPQRSPQSLWPRAQRQGRAQDPE